MIDCIRMLNALDDQFASTQRRLEARPDTAHLAGVYELIRSDVAIVRAQLIAANLHDTEALLHEAAPRGANPKIVYAEDIVDRLVDGRKTHLTVVDGGDPNVG